MITDTARRLGGPPTVWTVLAQEWWGVSPGDARKWWGALQHSDDPGCRALRQGVLLRAATPTQETAVLRHLLHTICSPRRLVVALEALVSEGQLARREASTIEELIFARMGRDGGWRGAQHGVD